MLVESLEKFGLSKKEASVYLTLLGLGPSLVSDISKKAKMNRSTTYVVLESLASLDLLTVFEKNKIKIYYPAAPEKLIDIAKTVLTKGEKLIKLSKDLVIQINKTHNKPQSKPRARFLDGIEGLKEAYEDTLKSSETIRAYASIENMHTTLPDYFPQYYKRRAAKGIHIRAIFPDTKEAKERIKKNKEEERTAFLVPKNKYSFSPEINIYDNKIVFMSLVEKFALIIQSRELADAFKKIFELSWEEAGRLDKTKRFH